MVLIEVKQLTLDGSVASARTVDTSTENALPILQCPYCLYSSFSFSDFTILNGPKRYAYGSYLKTIDGSKEKVLESGNVSKKMALCPNCHVTLRRKTLIQTGKMTVEEYASWVAWSNEYDKGKIRLGPGGPIRNFLEAHDIENEFWTAYKEEKKRLNPNWIPWDQRKQNLEQSRGEYSG